MANPLDMHTTFFLNEFQKKVQATMDLPLEQQRQLENEEARRKFNTYESVHTIADRVIQGKHGDIPIRIYSPSPSLKSKHPLLVYFHGGGWVYKGIDELEGVCRKLCHSLNAVIVSVGYRLSPENQFPVPFDDCYDATCWVAENSNELNSDPKFLGVSGDSVGGNLAAAVCLKARDFHYPTIRYQILLHPVIDPTLDDNSFQNSADQKFITKNLMKYFWDCYLGSQRDIVNPYATPLKAKTLSSLPVAYIATAEHDPLRFEAKAYANAMEKDGVDVTFDEYQNVIHGFLEYPINQEAVNQAYDNIKQWFENTVKKS